MKTVLIVDDEELFLASLAEGLSAYANDFIVVTSPEGEQATKILSSQPIDLVVTDLKMPIMDGLQLIAYMTRNYPPIPVIVMTAFSTPDIEDRVGEFDILDYMEKPIDYQVLAEKIRTGLSEPARGQIQGITLFSFLQLLQMEQKTCSLKIQSDENEGLLHFSAGELFNAVLGDTEGEEAAYKILSWDDTKIEIIPAARKMKKRIETSLNNLLMEAAQMKDENSLLSANDPHNIFGLEVLAPSLSAEPLSASGNGSRTVGVDTNGLRIYTNVDTDRSEVKYHREIQKIDSQLAGIQKKIPECIATGFVDMQSRKLLGICTIDSYPLEELNLIAAATADMFQGNNVLHIEHIFKQKHGLKDDRKHYFQEIITFSDKLILVFQRVKTLEDLAMVTVCRGSANLGLVISKARSCLMTFEMAA